MELIAILLALLLASWLPDREDWGLDAMFDRYSAWLRERFDDESGLNQPLLVVLLLLPPVLMVALLQLMLSGRLAGVLSLALAVAVLLACVPVTRPDQQLKGFARAWQRNDPATAREILQRLGSEEAAAVDDRGLPEAAVKCGVFQSHESLLGLLFWFVLLGPLGAVAWRTSCLARHSSGSVDGGVLDTWHHWLGWIPSRLAALSFGLMGSLNDMLSAWRAMAERPGNRELLQRTGLAAMRLDFSGDHESTAESVREARALLRRTLLLWLAVIAILTVVGWIG